MRLSLTFSTIILATLSTLWLQARLSSGKELFEFEWVLGLIIALQLIMLPIYHGALFADRKVRVLAATPDTVQGISAPLGIVDRTSEHVTLLGFDAEGKGRLATVKLEDLNGIPIERVVALTEFIGNALGGGLSGGRKGSGGLAAKLAIQVVDASGQAMGEQAMASQEPEVNKGFFATLADYLQMTLEAIGSLADSVVESGQLWVVDLDASGRMSEPKRIGLFDDLAWPVVGPDGSTFYALQRGRVVRLGKDGRSVDTLDDESRWTKLLGVANDGTVLGLVRDGGETKPAMIAPNRDTQVSPSPLSDEDKARVARLMQETRSYVGNRTLSVERSLRGGRGFDVFLKTGDNVVNLSDCGDDSCGQASLAPDFRLALFIRQPRY